MWHFIVSGYIPGTSIQITFDGLLSSLYLLALAVLCGLLIKKRATIRQEIIHAYEKLEHIKEVSL